MSVSATTPIDAFTHEAAVLPLATETLRFDPQEYHESEGVPVHMARQLAGVCTAWRAAVAKVGSDFLKRQTKIAIRTKSERLENVFAHFDSTLSMCPLKVPFGFHRPSPEAVRERRELLRWVNGRLRAMRVHVVVLKASLDECN